MYSIFPYLFVTLASISRYRTRYDDKNRGKSLTGLFSGFSAAIWNRRDTKYCVSIPPVTILCMWVIHFLLIAVTNNSNCNKRRVFLLWWNSMEKFMVPLASKTTSFVGSWRSYVPKSPVEQQICPKKTYTTECASMIAEDISINISRCVSIVVVYCGITRCNDVHCT